jgi:hypothetical protein
MPQPPSGPDDVLAAVRDFVGRVDEFDPQAPRQAELTVRIEGHRPAGQELRLTLRAPVARALVEALRAYQDPRDRGDCDHCGGRRLDDNFLCQDCGRPNGVFGQLLAEAAARYTEPPAIAPSPPVAGRHARDPD